MVEENLLETAKGRPALDWQFIFQQDNKLELQWDDLDQSIFVAQSKPRPKNTAQSETSKHLFMDSSSNITELLQ